MGPPVLSLVLPLYNEEAIIPELDRQLRALLAALGDDASNGVGNDVGDAWEVIFVNDGSNDRSLASLTALAAAEPRYKVLSLSRNFGQQMAITAGLDRANGEAVVVMDADLQDPPEIVRQMVARWREGYDVVFGVRSRRRGESAFKRWSAAAYYRLLRAMLGISIPVDAGDFRLLSRPVVLTLRALREQHRFVRGLVSWVGFRQTAVTYERPARFAGRTKYPLRKMMRFAIDGITSFSTVPLRIATWLGLVAGLVALAGGVWALWAKLAGHYVVRGWTTIMILIGLGSSAQLLMTGILGEYIGRIYEEVKRRPLYVVEGEINLAPAEPERRSGDGAPPPAPSAR